MILKRIKCHNYGILHDVDLELPLGVTGILGQWKDSVKSNGSGKSTFVDSIPWILTGKILSGNTMSDIIGNMDDNCFVEHWYDVGDGSNLHIKKGIKSSGDGFIEAGIIIDGKETSISENVNETKQRIERIHGFDSDMLLATSFFQQAQHDTFTKQAKTTKRKEYIRKIRGVGIFDKCHETGKERKKEHEIELARLQNLIESTNQDIKGIIEEDYNNDNFLSQINEISEKSKQYALNVDASKKERDSFISKNAVVQEIKNQIELLNQSITDINNQKSNILAKNTTLIQKKNSIEESLSGKNLHSLNESIIAYETEISELIEKLEDLNIKKQYLTEKKANLIFPESQTIKIQELQELIQKSSNQLAVINSEKQAVSKKLTNFNTLKEDTPCSVCNKILTGQEKQRELQSLTSSIQSFTNSYKLEEATYNKYNEQLKDLQEKEQKYINVNILSGELTSKIVTVNHEIKSTNNLIKSKNEAKQQAIQTKNNLEEAIEGMKKDIVEIDSLIASNNKELETLTSNISVIENKKQSKQNEIKIDYTETIDELNSQIKEIESSIESCVKHIEGLRHKQLLKETLEGKLKEYSAQLDTVVTTIDNYDKIIFNFSKNGVSNSFVEETVMEMQDLANKYLWQLDPTKSISFRTKTDTGKDTLDILVLDREKLRVYERYSGGEKTTINLCIRLALSNILNKRATRKMGLIILDEVFGQLCDYNRPLVVQLINQIRMAFNQIFVISHSDMKDQFENLILVERYDNYSTVRRIR